jgi:hypothetical protein
MEHVRLPTRPSSPTGQAFRATRRRLLGLVGGVLLFCLFLFGVGLNLGATYQYRQDLAASLLQTAQSFRSTRARDLDQLNRQAGLVVTDSRLQEYHQTLAMLAPDSPERVALQDSFRSHLVEILEAAGGDVLLMVGSDGRVQSSFQRPGIIPGEQAVEPSEATSPPEKGPADGSVPPELPSEGQSVEIPLVDAVFADGTARSGPVRLQPQGSFYLAAVVPLQPDRGQDGVLLLAKRVTEKTLAAWGHGLSDGIILIVADGTILVAHDRRAGRRPSPAILNSLERAVASWSSRADLPEQVTSEGEDSSLSTLDVGARRWLEHAVAMAPGEGGKPVGWVLFLGDPDAVEDKVARETWLVFRLGLGVLVLGLVLAWFLARWVMAPVDLQRHQENPVPNA